MPTETQLMSTFRMLQYCAEHNKPCPAIIAKDKATLNQLASRGLIRIEEYSARYLVILLLAGQFAGRTTKLPPKDWDARPNRVITKDGTFERGQAAAVS